jgi:hypothetical protein
MRRPVRYRFAVLKRTTFRCLLALPVFGLLGGCGKGGENGHGGPNLSENGPALYGPIKAAPSAHVPRVRPPDARSSDWTNAPLAVLQTELSPATLVHSTSSYLGLFQNMGAHGLGGPSHLAFSTRNGPRSFKKGDALEAIYMEENWVLVWFSGASGWTHWDSPWAVFLQHKPLAMILDDAGLHFQFRHAAGDVVLMPLYGYEKLPLSEPALPGRSLDRSKRPKTWQWSEFLPRNPLMRIRFWASATRDVPVYCEDTFSVDRARDTVTIRQKFQWHSIEDDWATRHHKVAPLSPPLALASQDERFPVSFSESVSDFDLFTAYGPYMGVEEADGFDATFKVLRYINETEASDPPDLAVHPTVAQALDRLRQTAREKFPRADRYQYDHGGLNNFCWAIMGDLWYAKGLPYYDAATRSNALASLRLYFHDDVLVTNRFKHREFPRGSGRFYDILEGPGIGSWGALGDAGKFSADLLETLWAYAHYTGDWDLIRERWPLVKRLFTTPAETRWVGFGRDGIAELGDEAAPCLAMARLAYRVGDIDTYQYACYMFARELVHLEVKQTGADYFREHQPGHTMESMDEEVYLTNLWGDTAGWQIDGPHYPAKTGERQFNNRWVRFKNEDVGRFYREHLLTNVTAELDRLGTRWDPKRKYHNDSHIMPSLVQLRSLLLNDSPQALAGLATPDQFAGPPSGVIASCLAVLRTGHPVRYERLIPPAPPSPFVTGLEREVAGPSVDLTQSVQIGSGAFNGKPRRPAWPLITWWKSWKTPSGERWNFGEIHPIHSDAPEDLQVREVPLNWNTRVLLYSWK